MYLKSHSVTIPFAQVSSYHMLKQSISNPGQKYEVSLKQDKVLPRTRGLSFITGYLQLLRKLRHLAASRSWQLTGHPSIRFPIFLGSLSAASPFVLSRASQSAVKGISS